MKVKLPRDAYGLELRMTRVPVFKSLFAKIAFAFALAIAFVSILQFFIAIAEYRRLLSQINQNLQWDVATFLGNRIQEDVLDGVDQSSFEAIILKYIEANPNIEVHLLDSKGNVLVTSHPSMLRANSRIPLEPILRALKPPSPQFPLYGKDPMFKMGGGIKEGLVFGPDPGKIFSVAPIQIGQNPGYIYVVLEGISFVVTYGQQGMYFIARIYVIGWLVLTFGSLLLAYFLFRFLTKHLRHITEIAEEYQGGDYSREIEVTTSDELGLLANTLNGMAKDLISAKEKIEAQDLSRRNLIARISHDLRSPLQIIIGNLAPLTRTAATASNEHTIGIRSSLDSAQLLNELVDNLFELSALEARETLPNIDAVSLIPLIDSLHTKFEPIAHQRKLSFSKKVSGEAALVLVDRVMLIRALSNLLENAFRHTPSGGSVELVAHFSDQEVEVKVEDNGPGISEADIERIVKPFTQTRSEANEDYSGVGLGLAIVSRILQLHQSELDIQSPVAEGGTSFSFKLSLED